MPPRTVKRHIILCHACPSPALFSTVCAKEPVINKKVNDKTEKPADCCVWRWPVRPPYYSVFFTELNPVTNHSSRNTTMFLVSGLLNNVVLAPRQVLTMCVLRCQNRSRNSHFLQMVVCSTHLTYVQTSFFLCVICPELLHSYHNCNVDSIFATDDQF